MIARPIDYFLIVWFVLVAAVRRSMQANPVVGIDLPLKALVWRDGSGTVWLTYDDPHWIARRHGLDTAVDARADSMAAALAAVARDATGG
jgi:uncharacterized protein (DUF302 family)